MFVGNADNFLRCTRGMYKRVPFVPFVKEGVVNCQDRVAEITHPSSIPPPTSQVTPCSGIALSTRSEIAVTFMSDSEARRRS